MKKSAPKTGPIISKGTKTLANSKPVKNPRGKSVGTPVTMKKGMHAQVTRHGFLRNAEHYK
jgi:hypothetical protein